MYLEGAGVLPTFERVTCSCQEAYADGVHDITHHLHCVQLAVSCGYSSGFQRVAGCNLFLISSRQQLTPYLRSKYWLNLSILLISKDNSH